MRAPRSVEIAFCVNNRPITMSGVSRAALTRQLRRILEIGCLPTDTDQERVTNARHQHRGRAYLREVCSHQATRPSAPTVPRAWNLWTLVAGIYLIIRPAPITRSA